MIYKTVREMSEREQLPLRIPSDVKKRLFELAENKGVSVNALILTIVGDWLEKYGGPRFKHFNVYQDHITIFDTTLGRLVDIHRRGKKLICEIDKSDECEHVRFCHTLPEVRKLVGKGDLKES
jgi:hypothetical protein